MKRTLIALVLLAGMSTPAMPQRAAASISPEKAARKRSPPGSLSERIYIVLPCTQLSRRLVHLSAEDSVEGVRRSLDGTQCVLKLHRQTMDSAIEYADLRLVARRTQAQAADLMLTAPWRNERE